MRVDLLINNVPLASLGLTMTYKSIGTISPRLTYIEVPGRDGAIDATDFHGVTYPKRKISAKFNLRDNDVFSKVRLYLEGWNGQKVEAVFTDDPNMTWNARFILNAYVSKDRGQRYSECEIVLDADPFPIDALTGQEVRGVQNFG